MITVGCLKVPAGDKYRPIVIVSNHGIYISEKKFGFPAVAIMFAEETIEDSKYLTWHFHSLGE